MVKVIFGKKGTGKTKVLVDTANSLVTASTGDIVFIDDGRQLIYDLKREIRFTDISEFPVEGVSSFLGFICGIISQNYDIEGIFIDGLTYILKEKVENLEEFFGKLESVSKRCDADFFITISGDMENVPEYLKKYL